MNDTFVIAGTSVAPDGVKSFRFTNNQLNLRVNMLKCCGHTRIKLVELPKPMTKPQAIAYLIQQDLGNGAVVNTRSPDKKRKTPEHIAAEKLIDRRQKAATTRAARKAA
jgi:hypothetical protein